MVKVSHRRSHTPITDRPGVEVVIPKPILLIVARSANRCTIPLIGRDV